MPCTYKNSNQIFSGSFLEISPPEKNEGFYHIMAWRQSWSFDPGAANKLSFPLPKETPHTIFGLINQAVSEENFFENKNICLTDAGPWVYYKLTYEPSAKVSLKCFFSEIWRFNRHGNIEHKQIPKYISYSMIT